MARPRRPSRFTVYDTKGKTLCYPKVGWDNESHRGGFSTFSDHRRFKPAMKALRRINSLGGCGIIELIKYDRRYKCRVVAATFSDPNNPADTETWFANRGVPEKV